MLQEENRTLADVVTFKSLANCFMKPEPSLAMVLRELEKSLSSIDAQAGKEARALAHDFQTVDLDDLMVDYARLFIGPFELLAPPFGSVYLEDSRQLMGDSTMDIKALYREAGLNMAPDFNNPPDHVAAELEFLAYLCSCEAQAGEEFERQRFRTLRNRFISGHIGAWGPEFTGKVEKNANTSFYKRLAGLTRHVLTRARQSFEDTAVPKPPENN